MQECYVLMNNITQDAKAIKYGETNEKSIVDKGLLVVELKVNKYFANVFLLNINEVKHETVFAF